MWRLVLAVSLLSWGSDGAVTCKDENGAQVHWYILYKAPHLPNRRLTGLEYLYIDSRGARRMDSTVPNYRSIKDPNGVLGHTLRPLFTPIRSMTNNFGFISYSDQPPGSHASKVFGHSKGVLMMDNSAGGTGVWLVHSTPQFPFRRNQNSFWPESGHRNAQTFLCVTFQYAEFSKIGLHLQEIGAFPFEHDLPATFHQELKDAVNWVRVARPQNNFRELISTDSTQKFYSLAKQQSAQTETGDLYATISAGVVDDLRVQTWGCQKKRAKSYCDSGLLKVLNVVNIQTPLGVWDRQHDHSKWCVAEHQNKPWTCITDVNRAVTQYERRGGALCLQNRVVKDAFLQFARDTEPCSPQTSPQTTPDTSPCEDSDYDP